MCRQQTFICLFLLAVMPTAAALTGAPDFPVYFQFFRPLLLLFLLSAKEAQASSRPPSLLTRDIKVSGIECTLSMWDNDDVWTYEGNTADGRPYYHNTGRIRLTGIKVGDFYIYYDANCDGKTGAAHSKKGHPQWVLTKYKPSLTREYDLEDDGRCTGDIAEAGGYSIEATFDWTFTFGKVNSACPHVLSDPNWATADLHGGLVGCPEPQPSYTLEWGGWASTDGKECGGTDMRTQIEVCADSSPEKDCPCKGRRDPAIPLQSETRLQAKCATTVTTSTSTTTTTTTTTSSSIETQATTSSSSSSSSSSSAPLLSVYPSPSSPPQSSPTSPGTPQGATAAPIAQDSSNSSDIFGHNETKPGSDVSGSDGRSDDDNASTGTGTGQGMGGGTIAAVSMGVLAVVGLVAGVLQWRSNKVSRQAQQTQGVAATHRNPTFANGDERVYLEPSATQAAMYDDGKVATTPTGGAIYAIPMENSNAAQASVVYATYAGGAGGSEGANANVRGNNRNMDVNGYQIDGHYDDVEGSTV